MNDSDSFHQLFGQFMYWWVCIWYIKTCPGSEDVAWKLNTILFIAYYNISTE